MAVREPVWEIAIEYQRLHRCPTMALDEVVALPVEQLSLEIGHPYLRCPNRLVPDGHGVMRAWGFNCKSNIVWHKIREVGGSDDRGVGSYFGGNVTELVLFLRNVATTAMPEIFN